MKIIIIGGGIGGFSVYHALRKELSDAHPSTTIKIYEAYPSASQTKNVIGAGLGLAPNGLRALASLSPKIVEDIQAQAFTGPTMTLRNSRGTLLGRISAGRKERYGFNQAMLPRATVHDAVLRGVPDDAVEWKKRAREVRETTEGVQVEFEDGTVEKGDLVIGADGVKSKAREAIFGRKYDATYDGLTGVGGFIPVTSLPEAFRKSLDEDPITMTFGPHGFFGYSPSTPLSIDTNSQQIMWWSTWEQSPAPPRDTPLSSIRAQLLARHSTWKSPHDAPDAPLFPTIISLGCGSEFDTPATASAVDKGLLVLPRHITPRLPSWSSPSGKIIIMGDAAHAMPPDAGQGVSCAVEDAVAIAMFLKHYISEGKAGDTAVGDTLRKTARAYEDMRMGRLAYILDAARRMGNGKRQLKWWEEKLRDTFVFLFCKFGPESINDRRFAYDVEAEVKKYLAKQSRL